NAGEWREWQDIPVHASDAEIVARTRACLASLVPHADVRYYTTSLAVRDLEQVRAALGYERINLYGASYGTRVAQHYLRHFGARTRSVILDGVVPVSQPVGPSTALDAEAALGDILRRCANDPVCRERFGDPASDYRAVRAALKLSTVPISVRDPTTGEDRPFEFGADHLASVLRLLSYTSEYAALLPLVLHAAAARPPQGFRAAAGAIPHGRARLAADHRRRHAQQRGVRRGRATLRGPPHRSGTPRIDLSRPPPARWPRQRVPRVAAR